MFRTSFNVSTCGVRRLWASSPASPVEHRLGNLREDFPWDWYRLENSLKIANHKINTDVRERITDTRCGSENQAKKNELAQMGIEPL